MALSKLSVGVLGMSVYASATALAYTVTKAGNSEPDQQLPNASERLATYDRNAASFDADIDKEESWMLMWWFRRNLVSRAFGRVLETSVGTGRNLTYYNSHLCHELVLSDMSEPMIAECSKRKCLVPTSTSVSSVEKIPFPDQSFDTVVNTFGLCSVAAPHLALEEMGRVCRHNGHILLLQHGQTAWFGFGWLARYLDRNAANHAQRHGCIWNRDITALVNQSSLRIVEHTTHHFGTTHFIVAAPAADIAASTDNQKM